MVILMTLTILVTVQSPKAWTQAAKSLNCVIQQTPFGPTVAGPSASEGKWQSQHCRGAPKEFVN